MGLNEMKQLLRPLGLYRLEEGDAVTAELSALAEGISLLMERLRRLEREAFIPTALEEGLSRRELLFGGAREALTAVERRARLTGKLSHIRGAWDRERILAELREQAENVVLNEDMPRQTLTAGGLPRGEKPDYYLPLWRALDAAAPAQVRILFDTVKPDWDTADGYGYSFDGLDHLSYSWDFLEEPG